MSTEEEFSKWLRRKEKSFEDNFKFAIKAWQSVEFTLISKYEIVLQWLSEQTKLKEEDFLEEDFKELLKLRAQPGLISQKVKKNFVEWLLKMSKKSEDSTRKWCELLQLLVEYELLQDLYRMDYELQCQVYGVLFASYDKYLRALEENNNTFLNTYESEFFASVMKCLKETIKRCGDVVLFESVFTSLSLSYLVEVLLLLRSFKVDFFDELLEMERLICLEIKDQALIKRIMRMPLHVRLLCLECSIRNRRGVETFLKLLLQNVLQNFLESSASDRDTSLSLTVAAYAMEMLGRHDVVLNLKMNEEQTALQFLGKQLYSAVKDAKDSHLKEVLMLLCAALRLNPLILEHNVFEITAWMILAPKSGDKEEQQLFEEYLVLLMDMFRRLSRAAKFINYLLKTLNENLKTADLSAGKKRKGKLDSSETPMKKISKLEAFNTEEYLGNSSKYLKILFQDFFKPILTKQSLNVNNALSASASFTKLQNFWPSNPVGLAFTKIITGLVSTPSLTIWKSLLFGLKELVENCKDLSELDEKCLFQLDFHAALLSQYFAGCKLAEQSDKFLKELQNLREFTLEVLKQFGKYLLEKEHQPRTMTAFLELSYYYSSFELLLIYYRPDGCEHETLQPSQAIEKLHSFLNPDEWTLIQQRVLNFGKSSCKHLLQRLKLQKSQASLLLLSTNNKKLSLKTLDKEALNSLLKTPQAVWYLKQLPRTEKETIASYLITKLELLPLAFNDLELLEFSSLAVYEELCKTFTSKHSLLKFLSCDFDNVRQCVEVTASELLIKQLIKVIISRSEDENKVKKLDTEQIKKNLDLLSLLPLGQLRRQRKTIIFALHLSLYHDLKAAQEDELALQALEILKDLLHFGQQVLIFKYLPTSSLLKLLPAESCWELYEFLFTTVRNEEKGTDQFLQGLATILEESQSAQNINDEQRKLLLAAIDTLSSLSGPCAKRMRKHLETFLKIFSEYLQNHFSAASDGTSKKDKKFVQKTLAGFAPYAAAILTKTTKVKEIKTGDQSNEEEQLKQVDEDFRRISKIYIGHSMDYRDPHAIRLMQVALNNRELLHLDQDEIEFVLTNYWSQIKEDLKKPKLKNQEEEKLNNKSIEAAVKMIIGNKTNEDLLLTLKTIATNVKETNFSNILRLLTLIAKCPFSTIKGAIFNEQYKQITFNITLRLCRDEQQQFKDYELIINLLNCHQAIIDNKMIPVSTDTMDSILSFLMDINIKKFPLCDTNIKLFNSLNLAMTEVCSSLIKQRHILLMDRVPQYMHIFKDLLQSIVWYKSDRQKDTALPTSEIEDLAELALKLEALMHLIAQHSVGVKRVAPFVLTFIINLVVANKRPTTLYNKIKTHIDSICYELVGICDHRVGRFILRCSSEAGRQLYELLVKDYQKYHKFKGKV